MLEEEVLAASLHRYKDGASFNLLGRPPQLELEHPHELLVGRVVVVADGFFQVLDPGLQSHVLFDFFERLVDAFCLVSGEEIEDAWRKRL